MRFLLYCDLHSANIYSFNVKKEKYTFSKYSRIEELYSTLNWINEKVTSLNVSMPINLGDTFHQALRFYVERYNYVFKSVNNINKSSLSKQGILIKGNHDESDDISALDTFEDVGETILIKNSIKIKYFSEINSHLIFIPYIRNQEKVKEAFNILYEKFKNAKSNTYVFCHLDIKEAYDSLIQSTYQLNKLNSYEDLHLEIYSAVFSGHIHFRKNIKNNFYYIGSILNHNFSDNLTRKGITILDIENGKCDMRFIENPFCPIFVKFNLENERQTNERIKRIEDEIKKYPNTNIYARICTINNEESRKKINDFIKKYEFLFTAYETKSIDSTEIIEDQENFYISKIDNINVLDMIIEKGEQLLKIKEKSPETIEKYISRLRKICPIN